MKSVTVRVPATAANLGPGFDCLALALDVTLEARLSLEGEGLEIEIEGEGEDRLPRGEDNLIVRAARRVFGAAGLDPRGVHLRCVNAIPIASGLGSSAAAVVAGLTAANALVGGKLTPQEILAEAVEVEGHPDNAAAALMGGLTVAASTDGRWTAPGLPVAEMKMALAIPDLELRTADMRRRELGQSLKNRSQPNPLETGQNQIGLADSGRRSNANRAHARPTSRFNPGGGVLHRDAFRRRHTEPAGGL